MAVPTHAAPRMTAMLVVSAILGVLAAGCFTDGRGDPGGSSGTTVSMGAATTGAGSGTTGEPGTTTTTATTGTATTTTATTTTTTGEPTTAPSSTTTGVTQTPTTIGPTCPSTDAFPDIGDLACRTCLADNCCESVSDCAGAPGCDALWSCVAQETCINVQEACPGYAEHSARIGAISACRQAACTGICALQPCAAEQAACQQSPDCLAITACVLANCSVPCPADQPECILICWNSCTVKNPPGKEPWSALLKCIGSNCP